MKGYKRKIIFNFILRAIFNPIFIILYTISLYELTSLLMYGRFGDNMKIFILCISLFLVYFIYTIYKIVRTIGKSNYRHIINDYVFYDEGIIISKKDDIRINFNDIKSFKIKKRYAFINLKTDEVIILSNKGDISVIKEKVNAISILDKFNIRFIWMCIVIILMIGVTAFYGRKVYYNSISFNGRLFYILDDLKNNKKVKLE